MPDSPASVPADSPTPPDRGRRAGTGRRPSGPLRRFGATLRLWRSRPARAAGPLAALLSVVILALPSAYCTEWPGPTQDVLGRSGGREVIRIEGARTYRDTGRLLLTTISANGVPGHPVTNAEVLGAWAAPDRVVMPREAVVPPGQTVEEYDRSEQREMTGSQDAAADAALALLRRRGTDVEDVTVSMHIDDIGGPSAGLMYALGVIDRLTPQRETGGRTVAGTGTISRKGKVGAIGGIRLKMLAARRDGASWFLAPKANCDEVSGHVPEGLRVVRVSTLEEAYRALSAIGGGKGGSLPSCPAS